MVRTFSKLADLHYLMGNYPRALDAVHEVLALDADNPQATGLRDRILDGPPLPAPEPWRYDYGYCGGYAPHYPIVRPYVTGVRYYSSIGLGIATTRPVYRYPAGFLHEKVILVDDDLAGVGTVNFDNRSFAINFEVTLWFAGGRMIEDVDRMLQADFAAAAPFTAEKRRMVAIWRRFIGEAARLFSPLL